MKWNEKPKETELHKTYNSKFIQFAYLKHTCIYTLTRAIYIWPCANLMQNITDNKYNDHHTILLPNRVAFRLDDRALN